MCERPLQAVHAQHAGHADGLTTHATARGVYSGSMTEIRRDQGTTRSMPARNFSRRVRFFVSVQPSHLVCL